MPEGEHLGAELGVGAGADQHEIDREETEAACVVVDQRPGQRRKTQDAALHSMP